MTLYDRQSPDRPPLCTECRYCDPRFPESPDLSRCSRTVDAVGEAQFCGVARAADAPCGPTGKLFEPRTHITPRRWWKF